MQSQKSAAHARLLAGWNQIAETGEVDPLCRSPVAAIIPAHPLEMCCHQQFHPFWVLSRYDRARQALFQQPPVSNGGVPAQVAI